MSLNPLQAVESRTVTYEMRRIHQNLSKFFLSCMGITHYLKILKITKSVVSPIFPNITEMSRSLFPWSNCFFPSKCIHQPFSFNKRTTCQKAQETSFQNLRFFSLTIIKQTCSILCKTLQVTNYYFKYLGT